MTPTKIRLPDGYVYITEEGYILQPASLKGWACVSAEMMAQGRSPETLPLTIDTEDELDFWLNLCENAGVWMRITSLPKTEIREHVE